MQKEKDVIIQFHRLLAQIVSEIERLFPDSAKIWKEYHDFGVYPHHVHKSKNAHMTACIILGTKIAAIFSYATHSSLNKTAERLAEMK
ncbi:MAG TPA: hypothetical protein ENG06_04120 [Thermoplasmatales archaeon]|nr:MAG: hypothetical protein FE046_02845 [Thermoplasmata archaeon]RLF32002.1 MAG: hypothetical protein DRN07_06010 [Thermoplasmata archaeon]HDN50943.1 hypothetical protein [Thermoplasmatales archaeon]